MRTHHRLLAAAAVLGFALTGCTDGDDGPDGTFVPLEPGQPAGIEDVVQHLFEAPKFPAPVAGEVVMVELRSPDVSRRHHVFLAELAGATGSLAEPLFPGMIVQIGPGESLTFPTGASLASLDGDEIVGVENCAAPCDATGPVLVAPLDWFQGIRTDASWSLIAPAPEV